MEQESTGRTRIWGGGHCGAPFAHAAASRTAELLRPPTPHSLPIEVHDLEIIQ